MISLFVKTFFLIAIVLSHFLLSQKAHGFVKDPLYDDLEGVALVRALLKDGKLDLAKDELELLKTADPAVSALLKGQWWYLKNEWGSALKELSRVNKSSALSSEALVWQGRSFYQQKDFKNCLSAYQEIAKNSTAQENDFIWKSVCEQKLHQPANAWKTLWIAKERFASFQVEQEIMGLQSHLKMPHEALDLAFQWFSTHSSPATHYLNVAELFQASQQTPLSLAILEMGRAQHPTNLDINLALSQIYFQKGMLWAAEEGFRRASITDAKYFYHTAELNRQTRRFQRSLYFNAAVVDEKERLKQKIATYVDANKYSLIASLDSVIQRSELNKDDEVRYALAYSLVRLGDLEKPLKHLSQITKPELIEKSTVLRQTLLDCQTSKNVCRL